MSFSAKTVITAAALGLGLSAAPASAQLLGSGYDSRSAGYAERGPGYNDDGTLNVFGAHIDPNRSLLGGAGNVVGGVTNGAGAAMGGFVDGIGR